MDIVIPYDGRSTESVLCVCVKCLQSMYSRVCVCNIYIYICTHMSAHTQKYFDMYAHIHVALSNRSPVPMCDQSLPVFCGHDAWLYRFLP